MRINTQAEFRQVEQRGGHFSLDREGRLQTQSAFRHTLQKIADFFRALTPGGRATIEARDRQLRAAMDEFIRQGALPNVAKSDIPRPAVPPEVLRQATSRARTSGAEAKAAQPGARTEAFAAPQTDNAQRERQLCAVLSQVHDMAEVEIARLLPGLDDETRSSFAFAVSERMNGFLQDAELPGGVLRDMVAEVAEDIVSSVSPEAPKPETKVETKPETKPETKVDAKVDTPKTEAKTDAPKADAVQTGARTDVKSVSSAGAAGASRLEQVNAVVADVVRARFGALPQQERAKIEADVKERFAAIRNLDERVQGDQALFEAVDFCARAMVRLRAGRNEAPFRSLSRELYAEPQKGQSLSLIELRSLVAGLSTEGQLRSELREMIISLVRRNYPGAGDMNSALLSSAILDRLPNVVDLARRVNFDMSALRRQMDAHVQSCAQEAEFAVLLNPKPERIVNERPLNGMNELTRANIRPDTILRQGDNTCFMLSVLNSMMTTERGRAMLASHLNDDGTMTLRPELASQQTGSGFGFSRLEHSLAAAYRLKDRDWSLGAMGIAPEFAGLFGMKEIYYREGSETPMGSIRSAADADTIRQHLERGNMVLLYKPHHYRAVVGVKGDLIVLRNSLGKGREEEVPIEDLAGGSVSVMAYPN